MEHTRVRREAGFTLIEVLAVMLIIGVLAAIAIPNFNSAREQAYISTMKGDLHSLRLAQELYNVGPEGEYASNTADLSEFFTPSENVTVTISGGGDTWSATATHPGTSVECTYDFPGNLIECAEPGPPAKK